MVTGTINGSAFTSKEAEINYYERHIGDYLKDTSHLSLLEHGVYTRLLDVYYTREGGIPAGDAARLVGARTKEERAALASVLSEFFEPHDGTHRQGRADREIERFRDKQAKAKRSAEARWSAQKTHSERNANASPNAMRTHSERNANGMHRAPVPSNQTPNTKESIEGAKAPSHPERGSGVHRFPPGFDAFWSAYPRKVGKDAAAKAFAKRRVDADLLAAMLAAVETQRHSDQWRRDGGQFIPHPAMWLKEGRWQDEAPRVEAVDAVFGAAL